MPVKSLKGPSGSIRTHKTPSFLVSGWKSLASVQKKPLRHLNLRLCWLSTEVMISLPEVIIFLPELLQQFLSYYLMVFLLRSDSFRFLARPWNFSHSWTLVHQQLSYKHVILLHHGALIWFLLVFWSWTRWSVTVRRLPVVVRNIVWASQLALFEKAH